MENIRFVRIRGRIVPIKTKDKVAGAKTGAGLAIAGGSGYAAGNIVNESWKAYGRSAHIRGLSKGLKGRVPAKVIAQTIKDAARFKVLGKALSRKGFGLLGLGIAAGSGLVDSGVKDFVKGENQKEALAIGTGATAALALTVFAKKSGIKHISKAIKGSGRMNIKNAFKAFNLYGKSKTSNIIRQYAKMNKKNTPSFAVKKLQRVAKGAKKYNIPGQGKFNL